MTVVPRSPSQRIENLYRLLFWITPFLLLLSGMQFEFTAIRILDQGHFIYTLDDPYIHLALAERIAQGHYGINPGEVSAPASSILWPFFLAPFARTSFFEYLPLVLNIIAAAGTLYIYIRVIREAMSDLPDLYARAVAGWMAVLLIPATNLIGLAFTGMEHSLQVFFCALIVWGMIRVARGFRAPPWLAVAIIVAPAIRYECLAVCLPALGLMAACRQWKPAAFALLGMILPLAVYSLFLHANGLGWLPTSVIAKVSFANYQPTNNFILDHLENNLQMRQGQVLGVLLLLLVGLAVYRRNAPRIERLLALGGAAAVFAHLAAGQIGWWDRYEVYMVVTSILLVIYLARGFFQRLFWSGWNRSGWLRYLWPPVNILLLGWLAWIAGQPYFGNFAQTALASANIYQQQYQMHRFAVDYLNAPVAVNDLGWVSYRNPNYVLDLWGLASPEALANRNAHAAPGWMDRMVYQKNARLIMIYDTWFPSHPRVWVRVARLHLGWKQIVAGGDTVTFYVPDAQSAGPVRALLEQFKPTLPPGVKMEIDP